MGPLAPSGPVFSVDVDPSVVNVSYASGVGRNVEIGILMLSDDHTPPALAIFSTAGYTFPEPVFVIQDSVQFVYIPPLINQ